MSLHRVLGRLRVWHAEHERGARDGHEETVAAHRLLAGYLAEDIAAVKLAIAFKAGSDVLVRERDALREVMVRSDAALKEQTAATQAARADVERLTRERDAARAATARAHEQLAAANRHNADTHDQRVAALRAERDRLAAALAGVLAAARACVDAFDDIGVPQAECRARNEALRVVLAATPADLADAHDAWVRAEGDAAALYDSRAEWSRRTFGEGDRYKGVVEHIRRELVEIERDPADLEEWVDVVMLAMDGAWRSAGADGAAFWAAFRAKAKKNEARAWAPPDAAGVVEHVRAEADRTERDPPPALDRCAVTDPSTDALLNEAERFASLPLGVAGLADLLLALVARTRELEAVAAARLEALQAAEPDEVAALRAEVARLTDEVADAWAAIGVRPDDGDDSPEPGTLADAVRFVVKREREKGDDRAADAWAEASSERDSASAALLTEQETAAALRARLASAEAELVGLRAAASEHVAAFDHGGLTPDEQHAAVAARGTTRQALRVALTSSAALAAARDARVRETALRDGARLVDLERSCREEHGADASQVAALRVAVAILWQAAEAERIERGGR